MALCLPAFCSRQSAAMQQCQPEYNAETKQSHAFVYFGKELLNPVLFSICIAALQAVTESFIRLPAPATRVCVLCMHT